MLILASASPRRRELLAKTGLDFKIVQSDFDESIDGVDIDARDYAIRCAYGKAKQVFERFKDAAINNNDYTNIDNSTKCSYKNSDKHNDEMCLYANNLMVLGADTVVLAGGEILGKPKTEALARDMLMRICGEPHSVITAICIITDKTLDLNSVNRLNELCGKDDEQNHVQIESFTDNLRCYSIIKAYAVTKLLIDNLITEKVDEYIKSGSPFDKAGGYGIQDKIIKDSLRFIDGSIDNVIGLPTELLCKIFSCF